MVGMNRACTVSRNRLFWGFILGLDLRKKKKSLIKLNVKFHQKYKERLGFNKT
jgi:hypothetical protein